MINNKEVKNIDQEHKELCLLNEIDVILSNEKVWGFKFNWTKVQEAKKEIQYREILKDLGVEEL